MTELERQLTEALKRLSAQYEREQRQHSEQVEALRQRDRAGAKRPRSASRHRGRRLVVLLDACAFRN